MCHSYTCFSCHLTAMRLLSHHVRLTSVVIRTTFFGIVGCCKLDSQIKAFKLHPEIDLYMVFVLTYKYQPLNCTQLCQCHNPKSVALKSDHQEAKQNK